MPYTYKEWKLYKKDVILKGGKKQTIYYFSKKTPKSGTQCDLPEGYKVKEFRTKGSHMPYLTKH